MSKTLETREEFLAASDADKLVALYGVLCESADRCGDNMLTAGTWVESTFRSVAAEIYKIAFTLEMDRSMSAKGQKSD